MKMIFAVVNNDDSRKVLQALREAGIYSTKIASTGGFLMKGNTVLLSGVEDEKVDETIELIKTHSKKRTQLVPAAYPGFGVNAASLSPVEVTVGGATIFVTDIEKFERA